MYGGGNTTRPSPLHSAVGETDPTLINRKKDVNMKINILKWKSRESS